jgi:hypothetical protein
MFAPRPVRPAKRGATKNLGRTGRVDVILVSTMPEFDEAQSPLADQTSSRGHHSRNDPVREPLR